MILLPRRKKPKKRNEGENIPTDSLTDIAFLLIIFFILTTTFQKLTGLTTDFPSSSKETTSEQQDKTPTINLKGTELYYNEKPIALDALKAQLAELDLSNKLEGDRIVLFEATGEVEYQTYYQAMSAITNAGGIIGIIREE